MGMLVPQPEGLVVAVAQAVPAGYPRAAQVSHCLLQVRRSRMVQAVAAQMVRAIQQTAQKPAAKAAAVASQ
jgi:hypothetical protein